MTRQEKSRKSANRPTAFQEYVRNKEIKQRTPFHIEPTGNGYYLFDGNKVNEKDFNIMFPTGLINRCRHEHLDGRQIF